VPDGKKCTPIHNRGGARSGSPGQAENMKTLEMPEQTQAGAFCLRRILVPVDFSSLSRKAVEYGTQLARQFRAELCLIHVLEPEVPPVYDGYMIPPPLPAVNISAVSEKKELKKLANSVRAAGVQQVDSNLRQGIASHEIVDAAKDLDADLIVIATHGYTGWKHFCIGSTAERVVRAAPCPVLVVREKEHGFITTSVYAEC